jgi:hypothetical protein
MSVPVELVQDLHLLSSDGTLMVMLEVDLDSGEFIRLTCANMDIEWRTYTWQSDIPFVVGLLNLTTAGKLPEAVIRVYDPLHVIEPRIIENDGFCGLPAVVYVINSKHLDQVVPIFEIEFEIQRPKKGGDIIEFSLGTNSPLNKLFPSQLITTDRCGYQGADSTYLGFKGPLCQYSGSDTTCERTFYACVDKSNTENYRGVPGLPSAVINDSA